MSRSELKASAKSQIKGKIGMFFCLTLLIGFLNAVSAPIIIGIFIVAPALMLGETLIYLSVVRGGESSVTDVFDGFKNFWPVFKVIFLTGLYTMLWSMLLIVPGLIKSYSYSQALYIIAENPSMGANEAITKSKEMMVGHKMELFVLQLSFIGWFLLFVITMGIAMIYVYPYYKATMAVYYNYLSGGVVASPTQNQSRSTYNIPHSQNTTPPKQTGEPPKSTLPRSCLD